MQQQQQPLGRESISEINQSINIAVIDLIGPHTPFPQRSNSSGSMSRLPQWRGVRPYLPFQAAAHRTLGAVVVCLQATASIQKVEQILQCKLTVVAALSALI